MAMIPITQLTGRLGNQMFQHAYIYTQFRKGNIPDIYLQDEKYFKEYEKEIRNMFGSDIGHLPYIAIHVRRGDYTNNPFYVDQFEDGYYERAMQEFPEEKFLVFSDDIAWCKEQRIFSDCQFSNGNEVEDMNRMASCKGQIISNSSFSWWAAWLSPHNGKVVAPKKWFTDGVQRITLPDSWNKI